MASTRLQTRKAQYVQVSGATAIYNHQQPAYYSNNTNTNADSDADADADADGDLDVPDSAYANATMKPNANTAAAQSPSASGPRSCSVCLTCGRSFTRRCDLNRHYRTHTRPFKCEVAMCEYVIRGFPTSQDLQRHMDDRHSDKTPIFHCSFGGCKYSSKRESNCKQHMEKTHNWVYDRTRRSNRNDYQAAPAGSNEQDQNDDEVDLGEVFAKQEDDESAVAGAAAVAAAAAMATPVAASSTLSPTMEDYAMHQQQQMRQFPPYMSASATPMPVVGAEADFTLYPGELPLPQEPVLGSGSVVYSNANSPSIGIATVSSNSYVPWESPLRQQEEISNLIQTAAHRLPPQQPLPMSVYPQAIGWFTPGNYHVAQVPLPASKPGSAAASVAAAFSPPATGFMGSPHLFQQRQQQPATSAPLPPLAATQPPFLPQGNMGPFPPAWATVMPSNTEAHRQILQQQQELFEEQSAVLRQTLRAQAEAEIQAVSAEAEAQTMQSPVDGNTAPHRGVKRTHDAYEGNASSTAQAGKDNANNRGHGRGNDDNGNDESEHNGRRPPQPPWTTHNDNAGFDDEHMPCPYHLTDPNYFSRDNEERFSPCHTQHKEISTLLRHLGRVAHNLIITENGAASFGVNEAGDRPQRQAGLCRRCWTSFTDKAAFTAHTAGGPPCARASRSKREKYGLIMNTFCSPPPAPVTVPGPIVVRPPAAPAAATPMPRGRPAPSLQPAVPIDGITRATAQLQAVPSASARDGTADGSRSPDIKVSPTQQEALARTNILTGRSPNPSLQGRGQGRDQGRPQPHHKKNNSVESATLVSPDYYVSRSEFQKSMQSMTQQIGALVDKVQRLEAAAPQRSVVFAASGGGGGGASSLSTRPPSSLGPGSARSIAGAVLQTDVGARERGSLVREMDRQTIIEEDKDGDEIDDSQNRDDAHRRHIHQHHHEPRVPPNVDAGQMPVGIGEPLRTLSFVSSSSNGSSVLHVPPPTSVAEDNSRVRKQRQQQHLQQQQQLLLGGHDGTVGATSGSQQQASLPDPVIEADLFQFLPSEHPFQLLEVETLLGTVPGTVTDSGYDSYDKDILQQGITLAAAPEVLLSSAKVDQLDGSVHHSSQHSVDVIDDGVLPPSMFPADDEADRR
ncbi:hypothetical protein SCUCBS95973_007466 [Sporothrix curviconia]|uniref:C2H2-type domain-containing protein n=1 Tax=Sporothrix curviconia TaxID=1260050 RepID=A0ABP0CDK4_9PEZI